MFYERQVVITIVIDELYLHCLQKKTSRFVVGKVATNWDAVDFCSG